MDAETQTEPKHHEPADPRRRSFLSTVSSVAMAGGLLAGYGTFACYAGRYLYPARARPRRWLFVIETSRLHAGDSIVYHTPAGAAVNIARRGESGGDSGGESGAGDGDGFVALSGTCPHLGCRVHWESVNHRFFCPCHNGVFEPSGKAVSGPPADAGQALLRYPLKVENGLLFIEVAE